MCGTFPARSPPSVSASRTAISEEYAGRSTFRVPRPDGGRSARWAPPLRHRPWPPGLASPTAGQRGGSVPQFYGDGIWPTSAGGTTHPLVGSARGVFGAAKASRDGTHLVTRYHAIDLTTSPETLEKGLSMANTLFKAFEGRGHPVRIAARSGFIRPSLDNWERPPSHGGDTQPVLWAPISPTIATVSGVPVGIAILEINEEILMRYMGDGLFARASATKPVAGITWTEWKHVPCGRLKLTAYSPHHPASWRREWIETRRNQLARTAEAIVAELESAAPTLPHAGFFLRG